MCSLMMMCVISLTWGSDVVFRLGLGCVVVVAVAPSLMFSLSLAISSTVLIPISHCTYHPRPLRPTVTKNFFIPPKVRIIPPLYIFLFHPNAHIPPHNLSNIFIRTPLVINFYKYISHEIKITCLVLMLTV